MLNAILYLVAVALVATATTIVCCKIACEVLASLDLITMAFG
jgi:hypothetical protein